MTKPSYEELERQLAELKRGLRNNNTDFELAFLDHYLDHFNTLTRRAEDAETSLARVRGLLQRITVICPAIYDDWATGYSYSCHYCLKAGDDSSTIKHDEDCAWVMAKDALAGVEIGKENSADESGACPTKCPQCLKEIDSYFEDRVYGRVRIFIEPSPRNHPPIFESAPPTFPQSSDLVSLGAESADIGKLDSADKSAITFSQGAPPMAGTPSIVSEPFEKPDEGEWVQPIESGYRMRCCDCKLTHRMDFRVYEGRAQFRVFREDAGSAETGGEKAACVRCRKVKAAHYKRFYCYETGMQNFNPDQESREPEKLNNAQKAASENCTLCGKTRDSVLHSASIAPLEMPHKFVALAESSLSSPPPCPTIPCVWCSGRGYIYVTGKRCEGCVGTGRLKDYSAKAGDEPAATSVTDSENTESHSAASPELLPTQLEEKQ